jgi:hypothetical protein
MYYKTTDLMHANMRTPADMRALGCHIWRSESHPHNFESYTVIPATNQPTNQNRAHKKGDVAKF